MLLVLASALKAEAKPTLSVTGTFFFNNMADDPVKAKSFTIEPSSISEMKVDESREISIKIEPEDAATPDINPVIDEAYNSFVAVTKNSNNNFTIIAQAISDSPVKIVFKADGLEDQTLTIQKIIPKEEPSHKTEEKLATDFKLNKGNFNTLQIGGTGVDFKITPVPETGILGEASFEIKPDDACQVKKNQDGSYHITAKNPCKNITIKIKVKDLDGKDKTITIKEIKDNQQADNKDGLQTTINLLQKRIDLLVSDSTSCHSIINKYEEENTSLTNRINQLDVELQQYKNNKSKISTTLAIIIGIVGTLIIAIIVFIILYKKIEKIFYEDLKDAEKETYELRRQLNDIHSDKSIKEKRLKELEGEIDKFKKENDSLKMEIMHLQKNTSKVQSTINQGIVEDTPAVDNKPTTPEPPRIVSLYSDCIVDGYFNRVSERPDEDTVFELVLDEENKSMASVNVYQGAHRRIIANPAFIDGCEKQIVGNSNVNVENKGIAEKDADNGKWRLIKAPIIEIR